MTLERVVSFDPFVYYRPSSQRIPEMQSRCNTHAPMGLRSYIPFTWARLTSPEIERPDPETVPARASFMPATANDRH